jgi:fused signal recognition particle receptor
VGVDIVVLVLGVVLVIAVAAYAIRVRPRRAAGVEEAGGEEPARARPGPEGLGARVRALFAGGAPGDAEWAGLEELLVRADVGPATATRIVKEVRERFAPGDDPRALIAEELVAILGRDHGLELPSDRLAVILVVGVNGSGKTTTIGKLAARLAAEGRTVSLAGGDTFRAAASEQLEVWAARAGAHLVAQERGADPAAVAFDAVTSAIARGVDVLIVDTAGRLHTRTPLMDELRKVRRVLEKAGGRPDEVLLVLDATTGQNGIAQAAAFAEAVEVTGVALTKLDGTAKGGIVLAVRERLGVPVKLIGTGEGIGDLETFDPHAFAERILGG